ncbi:MAG: response regulator receiver [Mucilaginibacter sp.]|nr:response regulator receiver [Mucilaginibacter sp.]
METIVVQETDKEVLEVLTIALQMEGFKVFASQNLDKNILDLVEKQKPHVVMLDYRLKGDAAIEMCKLIRKKYPYLPVIALSCNSNIHNIYSQQGFADYIEKPFDLDLLYAVLRKHISKLSDIVDKFV